MPKTGNDTTIEDRNRRLVEMRFGRLGLRADKVGVMQPLLPLDPCLLDLGLTRRDRRADLGKPPCIRDDNPNLADYRDNQFVFCKISEEAAKPAGWQPGFYLLPRTPMDSASGCSCTP